MAALPDLRTLNLLLEYGLRSLSFTIPTFTAVDDGVFDVDSFRLQPGAINLVPTNLSSNPSIQQLPVTTNADIQQYNVAALEMKIKRLMLDNTLVDDGQKRTATEVSQRVAELNLNLTSMMGRIVGDFLHPLILRCVDVLQSYGYLGAEFDMSLLTGGIIQPQIKTSMAQQPNQTKAQGIITALSLVSQLDPTGQAAVTTLKSDQLFPTLLEMLGMPKEFIRTPEEIALARQQQKEALEAQAFAEQAAKS
jgi:hypothetical protein